MADLATEIAKAISGKIEVKTTPTDEVVELINKTVSEAEARLKKEIAATRTISLKVKRGNKKPVDVGVQHKDFDKVLQLVSLRLNVSLVGAAGSGKTTLAENIAKALNLPFYAQSVGLQTTKSDLLGYMDATGKYVRTVLREAYEKGGVYLLDEMDAGNAGVLTILNAMTSNNIVAFPDGMIKKHPDFVVIAASNTYGRGSDRLYVGRNQLDAATLDRFVVINFDYDEALEIALSPVESWTKEVQAYRKAAQELKERIVISPRASINGGRMLEAGIPKEQVEEMALWKGVSPQIVDKIKAKAKERGGL